MAKEKEGLDDVSFWTTPADDGFRFSNLSSDHVSKLAESGPFVAVVLCYWDNVLGPRLQHVWRGVGDAEFQVNDLSNHRQSRLTINPLGQIIRICMGIYEHEFDKTVKMQINSHLTEFVCVVYVCM